MRVGIVQLDIVWEDRDANFRKVEGFLAEARKKEVDLLVLPEMFALGFTMNAAPFAEESDGPTTQFLSRSAREYGMHLLGACVFKSDGLPRNAAIPKAPQNSCEPLNQEISFRDNMNECTSLREITLCKESKQRDRW